MCNCICYCFSEITCMGLADLYKTTVAWGLAGTSEHVKRHEPLTVRQLNLIPSDRRKCHLTWHCTRDLNRTPFIAEDFFHSHYLPILYLHVPFLPPHTSSNTPFFKYTVEDILQFFLKKKNLFKKPRNVEIVSQFMPALICSALMINKINRTLNR